MTEEATKRELTPATWSLRDTWWGVAVGLLLAIFVPVILVAPFDPEFEDIGSKLAAQLLLTLCLLGTAIYMVKAAGDGGWRARLVALGWRRFKGTDLLLALAAVFASLICLVVYASLFGVPEQDDIAGDLGLDRGVVLASIAVFFICVLGPMVEETFFRGFAYAGLRGRFSRFPAALISGLIFGGVHAPSGPSAVVPLAVFGTILALLYEETDSIVPCVFAHVINNSIAISGA